VPALLQYYIFFSHQKPVFPIVTFPVLSANTCELSDKFSYPSLVQGHKEGSVDSAVS